MADHQISVERNTREENMPNIRRFGEIEEILDDLEVAFENFKNFDIVKDAPSDHNFLSKSLSKKARTMTIEKMKPEWESLKLFLANTSIYVRTYEKRPDLMRAIVVGPSGTHNHYALFIFDIRFPSKYPNQAPDIFYRTYLPSSKAKSYTNQRLKSFFNLKNKPCSTPRTTLQLLVQIHNSLRMNNHVIDGGEQGQDMTVAMMKQTWECMLCMLKSPPQGFEVFVRGHFRTRAHKILMNYKIHVGLDVTTIGLFSRLLRAFEDNGTYCQHHRTQEYFELLHLDVAPPSQQKSGGFAYVKKVSSEVLGKFCLG